MKVMVATPCYGGQCTTAYLRTVFNILEAAGQNQIEVDFLVTDGESLVSRARNNSVATFMQTDYDTLAFIDADIEMLGVDFVRLAKMEGVRGAAVCMKSQSGGELLSVWRDGEQLKRAEMPSESFCVDFLGAAVLFIPKSVFAALRDAQAVSAYEMAGFGECYEYFPTGVVDGTLLSEDYGFCALLNEAGIPIRCHPGVEVKHYGQAYWLA